MSYLIIRLLNNFMQWHEVGLTIIKAIVAIGILCLVAYLLTIGYIPSEISFGDTLIFLLIFVACSIVYAGLSMVLFFFGISLMPMVYLIFSIVDKYSPPHTRIGKKFPFPKISILTLGISLYFLHIISDLLLLHWKISLYVALTSSFISLFYYAFFINRQKIKEFSNKFENMQDIIDDSDASENLKTFARAKLKRLETHIKDSIQISFFLILIPIVPMFFIGDIGKIFLDFTMQKTGVRIEKTTLYIKEPYANLIELPKTTTEQLSQHKIFIFKDIKVLFQGIGKNTLISYKVKNIEKQIVIPNEYIIVEKVLNVNE
ncbi:hypothetical protein [Acinetobacter soli]|uniref:hypothetical protein n=1 Tax=Acinetobacter soli TaxID=487316 RepID=UPI0003AAFFD9|nr:hypothetical protein [Acinetobacter soli]